MPSLAREVNKLSARTVANLKQAGRHSDGGKLYLSISHNGGRRWVFMYRFDGKQLEMGLGSAGKAGTSLASARGLATEARLALRAGLYPLKAARRLDWLVAPFPRSENALTPMCRMIQQLA